ncbi:hypothetical protein KI688_004263 [Linnemannia hyalina]|uniref:Uncharacterized protein n=1 Tax=Linnemannia hyalina TaxID=64524 RepID=A0A9P7XLQ6_9FUNG|nr:hypothetical protein KI688_004263 [Linnemannia hyalina]
MVSSKQKFPVEVVELKKNAVVKKPSPLKTDPIVVAVESEDVEVAKGSKAKKFVVKKAATEISITKRVESETTAPKKAKSEDVEVVKDLKVKRVLAKKPNTSELKSIKKVQVERVETADVVKTKTIKIAKDKKKMATSATSTVVLSTPERTDNSRKQGHHPPPPFAQLLLQRPQESQKRPQDI